MGKAKTRQRITSAIVGLLGLGAICFAAFWLFPLLQDVYSSYNSIQDEIQTLNSRTGSDDIPTKGTIQQRKTYKKELEEVAGRCASFYLRQNQKLNQKILDSWQMDEYELASSFRGLKKQLAQKAGNPDFLELGMLDDWENKEQGKPNKRNFRELEKKSALASVLVETLTRDDNTVIELMNIDEPVKPSGMPPVPNVNWTPVRYRIFPVTISLSTKFSSLGQSLHRLTTVSRSAENTPCIRVRELHLDTLPQKGKVNVELAIDVLDFYDAPKEG